ncbi:LysE family translocator [Peribacillus aracenensis]|uniref:LysE family translocator n=1 Tax=Peribacillus aracenensis TaxID=2976708 RepID=UPI0021A766BB|nr:LysE family translocator [Peribacillus sp. BBB004]
MELSNLWLFLVTVVLLLVIPGPSVLYIIARSIDQGKKAGLVSVLGMSTSAAVHTLSAAVGMSAILMASSTAFNAIKLLGAVYLIYLGCKTLLSSKESSTFNTTKTNHKKLTKVFYESAIVGIFNPKTALFFLAFFPQFISPTGGSIPFQFLILGSVFIVIAFVSDSMYVLLASSIRNWINGSPMRTKIQNWLTGGTYISLGIVTAVAKSSQK